MVYKKISPNSFDACGAWYMCFFLNNCPINYLINYLSYGPHCFTIHSADLSKKLLTRQRNNKQTDIILEKAPFEYHAAHHTQITWIDPMAAQLLTAKHRYCESILQQLTVQVHCKEDEYLILTLKKRLSLINWGMLFRMLLLGFCLFRGLLMARGLTP